MRRRVAVVKDWLSGHGLEPRVLADGRQPVAVVADVAVRRPGPRYVLDAPLDTAAFGDTERWSFPPAAGDVVDGWLRGRGAADSKTAISIFCHIAARPRARPLDAGSVTLVFDLDEHTGGFAGIRAYLAEQDGAPIDGVMIGYPGPDKIIIGGRGLYRARLAGLARGVDDEVRLLLDQIRRFRQPRQRRDHVMVGRRARTGRVENGDP
jgi:succinyl-diaminopimelate desuccinylase